MKIAKQSNVLLLEINISQELVICMLIVSLLITACDSIDVLQNETNFHA